MVHYPMFFFRTHAVKCRRMSEFNIREATPDDAGALADLYNYYVANTHVTFDLEPVSAESRESWIADYNQSDHYRLFVGVLDNKVVGYASSSRFRPKPAYYRSVETTIYLAPDRGGHGFGSALYGHLLDSLTATDVHRCYGIIALPNDASVALHQRLGFKPVGQLSEVGYKFDRFWDTLWTEKIMPGN